MTWTQTTKNVATWANAVKNALYSYLLKEDAYYLLTEDGFKIIIFDGSYSEATKNTAIYTNKDKN